VSTGAIVGWVVAGLAMLAIGGALLAGGLVSTSVELSDGTAVPWVPPPADGSAGVVTATYKSKAGLTILGLRITPDRWEAQVMFVPPSGCDALPGDVLSAEGVCAGIPAEGKVSGDGMTEDGMRLLVVAVEVTRKCHEALAHGDAWPTAKVACQYRADGSQLNRWAEPACLSRRRAGGRPVRRVRTADRGRCRSPGRQS
jgi:hypothetical protein